MSPGSRSRRRSNGYHWVFLSKHTVLHCPTRGPTQPGSPVGARHHGRASPEDLALGRLLRTAETRAAASNLPGELSQTHTARERRNSVPQHSSLFAQNLLQQSCNGNILANMASSTTGLGKVLAHSLHLSSDQTQQREKLAEADRAAYRRKYWQGYAKKVKRIFGTVQPAEFAAAKQRAEDAGRSVWGQIWAEAT